ncbi:hypothetical protein HCA44_11870 [Rhodococcus sp. HNM0569]|nr:hypothetical protein [Rhodococcus sp. HNM0569]
MAAAASLAACGNASGSDGESADAAKWDTADPCTLVDDSTLTPLFPGALPASAPLESSGRNACRWGEADSFNTVTVTLTSAPQSHDPLRSITAAGREGKVIGENKYQCVVEFATDDSGTLSIETKFGIDAIVNPDTSCDRVAPSAEQALTNLSWEA